jgi:FKBP-type peptidyl-prolyl cis-trans isomerase 2
MYYIVDKDEIIRGLREEIKGLKKSEPKQIVVVPE